MLARIKHTFSLVAVLALFNLAATAGLGQQQVQSSATVTAASSGNVVRVSAPGNITHIRLEVFSAAGEKVFDSGNRDGNLLDWRWQDEKAPAGADSYLCVVTVQSLSGKTTRKLANLSFANQRASLKPVEIAQLTPVQTQALSATETDTPLTIIDGEQSIAATVLAHDGIDGQITRTRGAFTFRFGDFFSGKDKEQMRLTEDGRLGIGTSNPQATLDVAGSIRASKGVEFADGTVQTTGLSGRKDKDGNVIPNVGGTGTQDRLAKWTDNAGTLGDSLLGENSGGVELRPAVPGVGVNPILTNSGNLAGFAALRFYPAAGPNTNMSFSVVPRGVGVANNRAQFSIFNTDVVADPTNYEFAAMRARDSDFVLGTGKSGTGVNRPFMFASGFLSDNTTNNGQFYLAGNGNVGINTLVPSERLHVTGNGLFTGNLTVNGTLNATLPGGSGNYIQNNPPQQQTSSNFNISGNGTLGGTLSANVLTTPTITSPGSNLNINGSSTDLLLINRSMDTFADFRARSGLQTSSVDSFSPPFSAGPLSLGATRATKITIGGTGLSSDSNAIDLHGSTTVSGTLTQTGGTGVLTSQIGAFFTPLSIGTNSTTAVNIFKPTTVSGLLTANSGISTNTQTISGDLTVGGTITGTVSNANNAANLGGVAASQYVQTTDPRMTDARSPLANSDNYIQNNSLNLQPANFNISGNGIVGGHLTAGNTAIVGNSIEVSLAVFGTQPPPVSDSAGSDARDVLQVVGAKGGNTTLGFGVGGTGGNVLIQAGDGGDSPLNSGLGGSITLQPGGPGNGGFSELAGRVYLAPFGGNVGIGTANPQSSLQVFKDAQGVDTVGGNLILNRFFTSASGWRGASLFSYFPSAHGHDVLAFGVSESSTAPNTTAAVKMVVSANGNVGIGTTAPDNTLTVNGTADKPGGGSWGTFSDERLKNIKGRFAPGLNAVMQLQPLRYEYKPDNALGIKSSGEHIGFSAQAVEKIIPEAITKNDKGYLLVNNDPILWTMLNAIKEQQQTIEKLQQENFKLNARNADTETRLTAVETTMKRIARKTRRHTRRR